MSPSHVLPHSCVSVDTLPAEVRESKEASYAAWLPLWQTFAVAHQRYSRAADTEEAERLLSARLKTFHRMYHSADTQLVDEWIPNKEYVRDLVQALRLPWQERDENGQAANGEQQVKSDEGENSEEIGCLSPKDLLDTLHDTGLPSSPQETAGAHTAAGTLRPPCPAQLISNWPIAVMTFLVFLLAWLSTIHPSSVEPGFWSDAATNLSAIYKLESLRDIKARSTVKSYALGVCAIDHARCLLSPTLSIASRLNAHQQRGPGATFGYCQSFNCSASLGIMDGQYPAGAQTIQSMDKTITNLELHFTALAKFDAQYLANASAVVRAMLHESWEQKPLPPPCGTFFITRKPCLIITALRQKMGTYKLTSIRDDPASAAHRNVQHLLETLVRMASDRRAMQNNCTLKLSKVESAARLWYTSDEDPRKQNDSGLKYYFEYVVRNACLGRASLKELTKWLEVRVEDPSQPTFVEPASVETLTNALGMLAASFQARLKEVQRVRFWRDQNLLGLTDDARGLLIPLQRALNRADASYSAWHAVLLGPNEEKPLPS